MFKELLSVFQGSEPLRAMEKNFSAMLSLSYEMVISAGQMFFRGSASARERTDIYDRDVRVNQLQRQIRKQVVTHLSVSGNRPDVPYSLLLISLVKDVERIGDYAKNLADLNDIRAGVLPEDDLALELQEIRRDGKAVIRRIAVTRFSLVSLAAITMRQPRRRWYWGPATTNASAPTSSTCCLASSCRSTRSTTTTRMKCRRPGSEGTSTARMKRVLH
jgi:phosphate uptake regulator